ncbi:MAG: elongation factor P [Alphaproteobacteria bacterium]|nr:elongation factor P [Alphaproteobacteria bacterium]
MKVNANSLRVGNVIEHKGKLWVITKTQHTQPGKGGAYIQAEMKELTGETKTNERFRSSEDVERVHLDERSQQFLFQEGDDYTFMDQETYDQITIPGSLIGESAQFLQDGMMVSVFYHEGKALSASLPETIVMTITEADPVIKGQTASSSYKPAILENGCRIMVPPHIEAGTRVVINTVECSYVEKAKD